MYNAINNEELNFKFLKMSTYNKYLDELYFYMKEFYDFEKKFKLNLAQNYISGNIACLVDTEEIEKWKMNVAYDECLELLENYDKINFDKKQIQLYKENPIFHNINLKSYETLDEVCNLLKHNKRISIISQQFFCYLNQITYTPILFNYYTKNNQLLIYFGTGKSIFIPNYYIDKKLDSENIYIVDLPQNKQSFIESIFKNRNMSDILQGEKSLPINMSNLLNYTIKKDSMKKSGSFNFYLNDIDNFGKSISNLHSTKNNMNYNDSKLNISNNINDNNSKKVVNDNLNNSEKIIVDINKPFLKENNEMEEDKYIEENNEIQNYSMNDGKKQFTEKIQDNIDDNIINQKNDEYNNDYKNTYKYKEIEYNDIIKEKNNNPENINADKNNNEINNNTNNNEVFNTFRDNIKANKTTNENLENNNNPNIIIDPKKEIEIKEAIKNFPINSNLENDNADEEEKKLNDKEIKNNKEDDKEEINIISHKKVLIYNDPENEKIVENSKKVIMNTPTGDENNQIILNNEEENEAKEPNINNLDGNEMKNSTNIDLNIKNNSLNDIVPIFPIIGLKNNNGKSSYINTAIQCLCHTIPLTNYFLDEKNKDRIINNNILKNNPDEPQLSPSFLNLVENLIVNPNKIKIFSPLEFIKNIKTLNMNFTKEEENDVGELIIFILEQLDSELNNKNYEENNNTEINTNKDIIKNNFYKNLKNNDSIIYKTFFGGVCEITHECPKCKEENEERKEENKKTYEYRNLNYLTFQIKEVLDLSKKNDEKKDFVNIYDCLNYFQNTILLEGENGKNCEKCGKLNQILLTTKINTCQNNLLVLLNIDIEKDKDIKFKLDENIDVTEYVQEKVDDKKIIYDLYSIIYLIKNNEIHYIALCKDLIENLWYKYDDDNVEIIKNLNYELINFGIPVALFYQKK